MTEEQPKTPPPESKQTDKVECCICYSEVRMIVLPCNHNVCLSCYGRMNDTISHQYRNDHMKCPICRQKTLHKDLLIRVKKCANCVLCEYNTNVEEYIDGMSMEGLNERQKNALRIISQAVSRKLKDAQKGSYCIEDRVHFIKTSIKNNDGKVVMNFHTRRQSNDNCYICVKLNVLIRLEGDDGSNP